MRSALSENQTLPLQQTPSSLPTGQMSYRGVLNKSLGLFVVVVVVVAVMTWMAGPALWAPIGITGSVTALALGLILAFKKEPAPVLVVLFSVAEGALVGGISAMLNSVTQGIVLYAVLATVCTCAVVLMLFRSGKIRTSEKLTKIAVVAGLGYLAFMLVNFALTAFNVMPGMGMRDIEIFGIPLGIPLGIFAVLLAAYFLVMDFDNTKRGVEAGAPVAYEWTASWSLVATVVFMYVEFLRLFHYLSAFSD